MLSVKSRLTRHARAAWRLALPALLAAALPGTARAQVFYSYPGARPVSDYSPSLGAVAGFGDNLVRLAGFARFNVSPAADLGFEAVYDNVGAEGLDDDVGFGGAGVDFRYRIVAAGDNSPLDVAAQAGGGFLARSDYLDLRFPLGVVASRDIVLKDGRTLVPYGGIYVPIDYVKISGGAGGDQSDTDADVELRLGISAEIVKKGSLFAALHVGDDTMFFAGFNAGL
jgi:hypothetical protein